MEHLAGLQSQGQNLEQFSQLVGTPAVVPFITEADLSASLLDIFLLLCQQRAELLFQGCLHIQGTLPLAVFWYLCSVSAISKERWAALRITGLGDRKPVPDPPPHSTPWPPQSVHLESGCPLYDQACGTASRWRVTKGTGANIRCLFIPPVMMVIN